MIHPKLQINEWHGAILFLCRHLRGPNWYNGHTYYLHPQKLPTLTHTIIITILIPDEKELCIQRGIVLELLHLSKSSNSAYSIPPPPYEV